MKKKSDAMLYILIAVAAVVLAFSVYAYVSTNYYGERYQKAISAELADKCAVPPGYTEAEWQQHMSHHPDMYAECLK